MSKQVRRSPGMVSFTIKKVPDSKTVPQHFTIKQLLHVAVIVVILFAYSGFLPQGAKADDASSTPPTVTDDTSTTTPDSGIDPNATTTPDSKTPSLDMLSQDSPDNPAVPKTLFHFIKVICPTYGDIAGNTDAQVDDETGGNFTKFSNYDSGTQTVPPFSAFPVTSNEIPKNCTGAAGYTFNVYTTDTNPTGTTPATDASGMVTMAYSDLSVFPGVQDALTSGKKMWVNEVAPQNATATFGQLRCYYDALAGDNFAFVKFSKATIDQQEYPSDVYCIAYNVQKQNTPPPPGPCLVGPAHADAVTASSQGTLKDGSPITDPTRTSATNALGVADGVFFSLGKGGSVILTIPGYAQNVSGIDLVSHEITNGRDSYPEERAKVYVSQDNVTYFLAGEASSKDTGGVSSLDFASTGLSYAKYIKLVDDTDYSLHDTTADGYDLDALDITNQTCTPPCVVGPAHAAAVTAAAQGTLKDGSPITDATRTNPDNALGAADGVFFSLGKGGSVILTFSGNAMDVSGIDLVSHEITNGRDGYPEEKAKVFVSQDNVTYVAAGEASSKDSSGVTSLDFSSTGLPWIKYVKLVDDTDFSLHGDTADGYDLDAVDVTYQTCLRTNLSKVGIYDSAAGTITYTLHWSVVGTGSTEVTVTDPLPANTSFVSADNGGTFSAGTVTWNLGTKNGGDSGDLQLVVSVNTPNVWASQVIDTKQGTNKDGSPVLANRSDPSKALGPAESAGAAFDDPTSLTGTFYSLGFNLQGDGGWLTVKLGTPVTDTAGPDLQVFETTYGPPYPDEKARVEVSTNTTTWTSLGVVTKDGSVDLAGSGVTTANYVRITDLTDKTLHEPSADAYDLDAIKVLHPQTICTIDNTATAAWTSGDYTFKQTASTTVAINQAACGNDGGGGSNGGGGNSTTSTSSLVTLVVTITADQGAGGTVGSDLGGIACSPTCTAQYASGNVVTLTAHPDDNSTFVGTWTGACASFADNPVCTLTMDTNKNTNAHFSIKPNTGGGGGIVNTSSTGGSGGGGGGGGGSAFLTTTPVGQVLGDSTNIPSGGSGVTMPDPATPQVLGAATTLPRTGTALWYLVLTLMVSAGAAFCFSKRSVRQ